MISLYSFGCKLNLLASSSTNIGTEERPPSKIFINQIGSEVGKFEEKVHLKYLSFVELICLFSLILQHRINVSFKNLAMFF